MSKKRAAMAACDAITIIAFSTQQKASNSTISSVVSGVRRRCCKKLKQIKIKNIAVTAVTSDYSSFSHSHVDDNRHAFINATSSDLRALLFSFICGGGGSWRSPNENLKSKKDKKKNRNKETKNTQIS